MSTADYLREEGRVEGREEGRADGKEEGRAEGREEGKAEEQAKAKLEVENKICNAFIKYKNIELITDIFSMTEYEVKEILRSKGLL